MDTIATVPKTETVAHQTLRYSSTPDPMTRSDRKWLMARAAIQQIAMVIDTSM